MDAAGGARSIPVVGVTVAAAGGHPGDGRRLRVLPPRLRGHGGDGRSGVDVRRTGRGLRHRGDGRASPARRRPPGIDGRRRSADAGAGCRVRTSALGWGYPPPSDQTIDAAWQRLEPGSFLARCGGVATGTGGFTLVGPVARFWGAAVVPAARGRGVYRALVASRLRAAAAREATLALVHAGPASSPILQRLGFVKFGERRTFRVVVDAE